MNGGILKSDQFIKLMGTKKGNLHLISAIIRNLLNNFTLIKTLMDASE